MTETRYRKVVISGAAGLVGQNLVPRLMAKGFTDIAVVDKHPTNVKVLARHHPTIRVLNRDLAENSNKKVNDWSGELSGCNALVIAHAQIGGLEQAEYVRNNVIATKRLLEAAPQHRVPYVVSISSSVVNSMAIDNYTETKKAQEALVAASGIKQVVLRPTLVCGWFDRKHVGWLARFMQRVPVFPIPGSGKFLRQPLYAADFCDLIVSSIMNETTGTYNITGQERIDYIDLIRAVKKRPGAKTRIQTVPYRLFWSLLKNKCNV